jgi:hypothetical protein
LEKGWAKINLLEKGWTKINLLEKGWTKITTDGKATQVVSEASGKRSKW